MKFQIGSKVEVLSKKKTPLGAWRLAEVVSDKGDDCIVTYEGYFGISKGTIERVKKDTIRPCPPPLKSVVDWVIGDIIEALDDGYWKVAVVEFVKRDGFYVVRALGSFDEFKVQKSNIRVRQAWKDNKWIILDKDSCDDLMTKAQRTLKRTFPHNAGHSEAYENCKKSRAVEEDLLAFSSPDTRKVDSAAYLQGAWSQSNFHSSQSDSNFAASGANFVKHSPAVFHDRMLQQNASDSISSVGSCSAIDCGTFAYDSENFNTFSSDAESYYRAPHEEGRHEPFQEKSYGYSTHILELHSYRGTLEALYASGPLSWELETYLTDLRAMLHISSDEHLAEVRKLQSLSTDLCFS